MLRYFVHWKCLVLLVLFALTVGTPGRADVIYDTHDYLSNNLLEVVTNGDDGTPGRPAGSQMGNTILFGGTARYLTNASLIWASFSPQSAQDITLSLYLPDGAPDLTGPGTNGLQPGTLLTQRTVTYGPTTGDNYQLLNFNFNTVVPDEVIAIVSSSFVPPGPGAPWTGVAASTDLTPLVGSNPFGDRLWFGSGAGTFQSNNTWVQADIGSTDYSNNLAMTFNAIQVSAPTPEPGSLALLAGGSISGITLLRRKRARV